jgi:hypothetical protein
MKTKIKKKLVKSALYAVKFLNRLMKMSKGQFS